MTLGTLIPSSNHLVCNFVVRIHSCFCTIWKMHEVSDEFSVGFG